jgi:D-aminopeptidase
MIPVARMNIPMMMMPAADGSCAGGLEDVPNVATRVQKNGIIGCISHMTLSQDYHVKLITQATKEVNIRTCI